MLTTIIELVKAVWVKWEGKEENERKLGNGVRREKEQEPF